MSGARRPRGARRSAPALLLLAASAGCATQLAETPAEAWARAGQGGRVTSVRELAELELEGGDEAVLVKEGGAWRVLRAPAGPDAQDTPAHALATFFRAVAAGRLDLVRRLIPARHLARFADDEALRAHLAAQAERIRRAELGLGRAARGAELEGDRAFVAWGEGEGEAAELEREEGVWKIVDLE